jgi:hypothetical protein
VRPNTFEDRQSSQFTEKVGVETWNFGRQKDGSEMMTGEGERRRREGRGRGSGRCKYWRWRRRRRRQRQVQAGSTRHEACPPLLSNYLYLR